MLQVSGTQTEIKWHKSKNSFAFFAIIALFENSISGVFLKKVAASTQIIAMHVDSRAVLRTLNIPAKLQFVYIGMLVLDYKSQCLVRWTNDVCQYSNNYKNKGDKGNK